MSPPALLTPYQKRLFLFLGAATFFEGFDFLALAQILPNLRADFGVSKLSAGLLFAFVNFGTVLAWFLVRRADRWGRRPLLITTIAGYTTFSFLSGLSWDLYSFAFFQFVARIFLIGEWATSMVIASEEFPADRRGTFIGVLQAFSSLGAVLCAALVPVLLHAPWGWRTVYFVGTVPLLLLAYARRGLRETSRFAELKDKLQEAQPLTRILRGPYRRRVLQLGLIWALTYVCSNTAVSFWKEFAVGDRGLSDAEVGVALAVAALVSMPLVFAAGKLMDVLGRRRASVLIFCATSLGVFGAYSAHGRAALTVSLCVAIFGVSAVLPVLNAFTTELFPTDLRSDAFAWVNNLLGRVGYVLAPIGVGILAEEWGWGAAIRPTALFPLLALALILAWLPETNAMELEESSRIGGGEL